MYVMENILFQYSYRVEKWIEFHRRCLCVCVDVNKKGWQSIEISVIVVCRSCIIENEEFSSRWNYLRFEQSAASLSNHFLFAYNEREMNRNEFYITSIVFPCYIIVSNKEI